MEERLPEIEEFADIGDFIDEPVSTYSSGMHARLAFAVSVSLKPDILILDEILAVGDAAFQQKCIGRLHELLAAGVTLLFVSHATDAVRSICKQGLLLAGGKQKFFGPAPEAVDRYFKIVREQQTARGLRKHESLVATPPPAPIEDAEATPEEDEASAAESAGSNVAAVEGEDRGGRGREANESGRYGSGHARIESVALLDDEGRPRDGYMFGEQVTVEVVFRAGVDLAKADALIRVRDKTGIELFGVSVNDERGGEGGGGPGAGKGKLAGLKSGELVRVAFRFVNNLKAGPHGVTVTLTRPPDRLGDGLITLDHIDAAAAFVSLPQTEKLIRGKYHHPCRVEWSVVRSGHPSGV
jgi:energy-coupling factor transporter ATP-binding protein EcfA2